MNVTNPGDVGDGRVCVKSLGGGEQVSASVLGGYARRSGSWTEG